jgi:hypothetical protein
MDWWGLWAAVSKGCGGSRRPELCGQRMRQGGAPGEAVPGEALRSRQAGTCGLKDWVAGSLLSPQHEGLGGHRERLCLSICLSLPPVGSHLPSQTHTFLTGGRG